MVVTLCNCSHRIQRREMDSVSSLTSCSTSDEDRKVILSNVVELSF
uniref:Uncharacterized protein n=1 Tax=Arundo donax TaxID=35708 RepID=A0A0A8Y2P2_ARUDO